MRAHPVHGAIRRASAALAAAAITIATLVACAATGSPPDTNARALLPAGGALLHSSAGFVSAATEECGAYASVYGECVLAIENPDTLSMAFAQACAAPGRPASLVLRDRDLVTPSEAGYAFEGCA